METKRSSDPAHHRLNKNMPRMATLTLTAFGAPSLYTQCTTTSPWDISFQTANLHHIGSHLRFLHLWLYITSPVAITVMRLYVRATFHVSWQAVQFVLWFRWPGTSIKMFVYSRVTVLEHGNDWVRRATARPCIGLLVQFLRVEIFYLLRLSMRPSKNSSWR